MTTHFLPELYLERPLVNDGSLEFESLIRRELELLGEDPKREGLLRTPARVATALKWMTQGYGSSAEEVVGSGIFREEHDNMIKFLRLAHSGERTPRY